MLRSSRERIETCRLLRRDGAECVETSRQALAKSYDLIRRTDQAVKYFDLSANSFNSDKAAPPGGGSRESE